VAGLSELRNALSFDPTQMVRADDEADILAAAAALDAVSGTMDNKGDVENGYDGAAAPSDGVNSAAGVAVASMFKAYGRRVYGQMTVDNLKQFGRSARSQVTADGFLSASSFSVPKVEQVLGRVQRNVRDFYTPYGAVFGIVAAYSVITSAWLLAGLLVLFSAYMFLFNVYKDVPVKIGDSVLEAPQKTAVFTTLTLVVFIFCGVLSNIMYVLFYGTLISFVHAAFHKGKSQIKQGNDAAEQERMVLEPGMGASGQMDMA
jgi:hypothetical protein